MDCGFDTFFSLNDIPMDQESFSKTFSELLDEYKHYNDLFDIYNDYEGINNLKTINDMAGIQPVEVEDAIIELLLEARDFYELSDGAFDITMGNLLKVWHEYRTEGMALNEQGKPGRLP
ncbi:MAG: FAD:protein FMN transferase, partial [Solobacterium sp.]|nr:FAD:protein FMN transferase [Solobacterium sp.]